MVQVVAVPGAAQIDATWNKSDDTDGGTPDAEKLNVTAPGKDAMTTVRWGIVGTARIAKQWLAAARTCDRVEVVAIASRSLNAARSFATTYGIDRAYGSYDALLGDNDVDAVYIPLPTSLHACWTGLAIKANKHVLCEKPIATVARDAEQLLRLQQSAGVHVAEGFPNLYHPQFIALRELCRSGRIGAIRCIYAAYSTPLLSRGGIIAEADLGGGALFALGCYGISFATALMGLEGHCASATATHTACGVDEFVASMLTYGESTTAFVYASITGVACQSVVIQSDNACVHVAVPFRPDLDGNSNGYVVVDDRGAELTAAFPSYNPFAAEIDVFTSKVLGGDPIDPWPLSLSVQVVRTIEAIQQSTSRSTKDAR